MYILKTDAVAGSATPRSISNWKYFWLSKENKRKYVKMSLYEYRTMLARTNQRANDEAWERMKEKAATKQSYARAREASKRANDSRKLQSRSSDEMGYMPGGYYSDSHTPPSFHDTSSHDSGGFSGFGGGSGGGSGSSGGWGDSSSDSGGGDSGGGDGGGGGGD